MRVLITGASGFAGQWLLRACRDHGDQVTAISRGRAVTDPADQVSAIDLRDAVGTARVMAQAQPEVVYHLAALSHVGRSWQDPAETLDANVMGALNLLEALRRHAPDARLVWISSCEIYGSPRSLPIEESGRVAPRTPYGVSKATGEMLADAYAQTYGIDLVVARPFNHAGPGQRADFIVSSLAQQAARARLAGAARLKIVTGNPESRRDFTDVRDVVRAYRLMASRQVSPGVYNVSSGRSVSVAGQLANLTALVAPMEIEHVIDPALFRGNEVQDYRGSYERLRAATGWQPDIPLKQTMADTLSWWEEQLAGTGP